MNRLFQALAKHQLACLALPFHSSTCWAGKAPVCRLPPQEEGNYLRVTFISISPQPFPSFYILVRANQLIKYVYFFFFWRVDAAFNEALYTYFIIVLIFTMSHYTLMNPSIACAFLSCNRGGFFCSSLFSKPRASVVPLLNYTCSKEPTASGIIFRS